ncbi:hypothetical protein [Acidipropionibacterium virtanenii]|uniref:hypothetical protein n=1 Tax=Acidipropionibacterium virtanenii TaxID=2057246 RepID=UPI000DEC14C6|nr:hypothetical protein [Acidipropionibacterium virtanenii]
MLSRLVGHRLRSLEVALGEPLRLCFDRPGARSPRLVLSCRSWPDVERSGGTWRDGDLGFTDVLRSLLGTTVLSTAERTELGLRIQFAHGALIINPRRADPSAEIAQLSGFADGRWMAWWPGDYAFENLI